MESRRTGESGEMNCWDGKSFLEGGYRWTNAWKQELTL